MIFSVNLCIILIEIRIKTERNSDMDLNALRDEIDSLDKEILKAFEKRMELCRNVALYKKANGMQIFQSQREKEIIKRLAREKFTI